MSSASRRHPTESPEERIIAKSGDYFLVTGPACGRKQQDVFPSPETPFGIVPKRLYKIEKTVQVFVTPLRYPVQVVFGRIGIQPKSLLS